MAARHAGCMNTESSGSCQMPKLLAQSLLPQEPDLPYRTTNCLHSSDCIFCDCPRQQGALVENRGLPGMGDVPKGNLYI